MSLHPSLRIDTASAKQRSVLTRIERIKDLMKKGLWAENQGVTALPKTKIVRIKAAKAAKKEEAAPDAAGAAAAPAPGAAPAAAKPGKDKEVKKEAKK